MWKRQAAGLLRRFSWRHALENPVKLHSQQGRALQSTSDIITDRHRRATQYLANGFHQSDPQLAYCDRSRGDLDFSSCDYLGIAESEALNEIEAEAIREWGRIHYNRSAVYPRNSASPVRAFEQEAAEWMKCENTLLVNTGTEANVNVMQFLLANNKMPIYADKFAHHTFTFGAQSAGRNDSLFFEHNDPDDLLRLVRCHGPGVVCIDTIYSAQGDVAPLAEIVDICDSYDCILVADESHAVGAVGDEGEGLVKHSGLEDAVPFRTTSLGKSFGAGGGLIALRSDVAEAKELMPLMCSIPIFSLAPQESLAVRLLATLPLIRQERWRREELNRKSALFRAGCIRRGYNGRNIRQDATNVIPFVVGAVDFAKAMYDMCVRRGIYPSPHFYPASPRNRSVVRFTICNTLSEENIQTALDFLEDICPEVRPWEWPDQ